MKQHKPKTSIKSHVIRIAVAVLLIAVTAAGTLCASALSRYGSRGSEVTKIQQKLKQWGYYSGAIDGIYGSKTTEAVKYFQRSNGLTVDGVAGPQTLAAMGISSTTSSTGSYGSSDYQLLARVISAEARGEPYSGQVAVGAVVLNRVKHTSFPNTVAGVVYQAGAFTCVSDGQINLEPKEECYRAARDALNGVDPSGGAIYYYNPRTATNSWIRSRPVICTIGSHIFCK